MEVLTISLSKSMNMAGRTKIRLSVLMRAHWESRVQMELITVL